MLHEMEYGGHVPPPKFRGTPLNAAAQNILVERMLKQQPSQKLLRKPMGVVVFASAPSPQQNNASMAPSQCWQVDDTAGCYLPGCPHTLFIQEA